MKTDSPFSKLPSLNELLKHPTVQGVVERVNQTTIAQRATGFWEELQATWKEQGGAPSVGELAERLAQRLLGPSQNYASIVNATGVLCSRKWQAPLAEAAVHELLRFASDYQQPSSLIMDRVVALLVKLTGAEAAWVAGSFETAVSLANQCEQVTVVSSPLIGFVNPADLGREHVDTIADQLQRGDMVVVDGSGLLGGPRCGIVVGSKRVVKQLLESDLAPALSAEPMILAALEATLELYRLPEKVLHQIPILQLLSAPLENLQQRCERIAPLLAECEGVADAHVVETKSVWLDDGQSQWESATWAIRLRPKQWSLNELAQQLEAANPQIIGRIEQDAYCLDFRAVFPRWDQQLVMALS